MCICAGVRYMINYLMIFSIYTRGIIFDLISLVEYVLEYVPSASYVTTKWGGSSNKTAEVEALFVSAGVAR